MRLLEEILNRWRIILRFITLFVLMSCLNSCIFFDLISQPINVHAGNSINVDLTVRLQPNEDIINTHFIFAVLLPSQIANEKNVIIHYTSNRGNGMMTAIPENLKIVIGNQKLSWQDALINTYGTGDNALTDMKWLVFQTIPIYTVKAKEKDIIGTIHLQFLAGTRNLTFRPSYFIANTVSGFERATKNVNTNPLSIINGGNTTINFIKPQLSDVVPLSGCSKSLLTITFNANALPNRLDKETQLFVSSKAISYDHEVIVRTGLKMLAIGNNSWRTYIKPEQYFGSDKIERIEYFISDAAGKNVGINGGSRPFVYKLSRK
jgi:hypothetical protein